MKSNYTRNHYVPVWYQKRFIQLGSKDSELFLLDLKPGTFTDGRGIVHKRNELHRRGPKKCFVEPDLYTTILNGHRSTEVEEVFFGEIDNAGRNAVDHFAKFTHTLEGTHDAFPKLMSYMSTQRLRTPKGLGWLRKNSEANDKTELLLHLQFSKNQFSAIWAECVWLIADATLSPTKFIVSDHPVTTYHRELRPLAKECVEFNDPDIRMVGTHTIFPLSSEKALILSNLSWVLNPYQASKKVRPNPTYERDAIFKILDIQCERHMSEQEVREINFIIKKRAFRYIAAGAEDWLYPERHVELGQWNKFTKGYLCMPDPRSVHFGGALLIGYKSGLSDGFDPFGRRPWQRGFSVDPPRKDAPTFYSFRGEFSRLFGPKRRGRNFEFSSLAPEEDSPESHAANLRMDKQRRRL